jgi:glutamate-1-semialdehyde aminotransferase
VLGGGVAWSLAGCEATVLDRVSVETDLFHSQAKAGTVAAMRSMAAANKRVIVWSPAGMRTICNYAGRS